MDSLNNKVHKIKGRNIGRIALVKYAIIITANCIGCVKLYIPVIQTLFLCGPIILAYNEIFERINNVTLRIRTRTRLSFEVKLTNVLDYYEIKVSMCNNRSEMMQYLYFMVSYAPTVGTDLFRLSLKITAGVGMIVVSIDASNAFQTTIISDSTRHVYITPPTMYLDWIKVRFLSHLLAKYWNSKESVMQSLKDVQGTKDLGPTSINYWLKI